MRYLACLTIALCAVTAPMLARASTIQTSFVLSGVVQPSCSSTNKGSISVQCPSGAAYEVTITQFACPKNGSFSAQDCRTLDTEKALSANVTPSLEVSTYTMPQTSDLSASEISVVSVTVAY